MSIQVPERNWSGNYEYRATAVHHPVGLDELRRLVTEATAVHALGSRHSFTGIADSAELVVLDRIPGAIEIDRDASTVTVPAGVTYASLAEELNRHRLALANMASLPHISVVGAVATATHGSGERLGNLATAVSGLEVVLSTGDVVFARRRDERFAGMVVALGALGVVTRVTLDVEPYYEVRQHVYEGLEWDALFANFDAIVGAGNSVSVFHRFGERAEQVWVKRRVEGGARGGDPDAPLPDLFGARPADGPRNPVLGGDPANCTAQLGVPGAWSERLPHFRSGFTPSSGEEIQSEVFVARADAIEALRSVSELADEIRPLLLVSELRTIAADRLWLSPHHGRDSAAIHFTWRRRQDEVERVMARIEAALAPFAARPHWAKLTTLSADAIAPLYPRLSDFRRLRDDLDPRGAFVNPWLRLHLLEPA